MTKKDYVAIARQFHSHNEICKEADLPVVRLAGEFSANIELANMLADWFQTDNPQFDRGRFLEACR